MKVLWLCNMMLPVIAGHMGQEGTNKEGWGSGTAAVISPVGTLRYGDEVMEIAGGGIGPVSQKLYDTVTGIQTGKFPDEFGWTVEVK